MRTFCNLSSFPLFHMFAQKDEKKFLEQYPPNDRLSCFFTPNPHMMQISIPGFLKTIFCLVEIVKSFYSMWYIPSEEYTHVR